MEEKTHWWQRLWHRIESVHTAYWLWEIALAALAAWNSRRFMPHTISPTGYWFPITVFFGTLAILTTFVQITTRTYRSAMGRIYRKRLIARLHALDGQERAIFNSFISRNTRTLPFDYNNGTVQNLIFFGFLFRPNQYVDLRHPNPTVMVDWVWDYLHEHPELLGKRGK
jgi:hypothetical protein